MTFPPYSTQTEQIQKLLHDIAVLREAYELHPIDQHSALRLRRQAILKSSLYSARIEGNPLEWRDIADEPLTHVHERHKKEITNIATALEHARLNKDIPLSTAILRKLHEIILSDIASSAGHFRTEESAIYNEAGIAVYLTPPPQKISELLMTWYDYCNGTQDPAPVKAAVGHIWFEKIHPFLDGNGRVGRAITSLLLARGAYDFGGLVPMEEYLDTHKDEYYRVLTIDKSDVSEFVSFFLTGLYIQGKQSLEEALNPKVIRYPHLLPRRAEIVSIVGDHTMVSFDFLARRFRAVPERTLHHDLAQLVTQGYIRKLGVTRGAMYAPGEENSS